jgi:hypothetical protein
MIAEAKALLMERNNMTEEKVDGRQTSAVFSTEGHDAKLGRGN